MHLLSSSLRIRSPESTLRIAKLFAKRLQITRVTDTTWLDRIGIPVYASIRPAAASGSLCVNAGKGARKIDAEVGAYMEAIEFALAEYGVSGVTTHISTPAEVAASSQGSFSFNSLCPILGTSVDPNGRIDAVVANEIAGNGHSLLPAELIFIPYGIEDGQLIFGESSNGLCSGNSVEEATVHGLCELIERDVQSLDYFRDHSQKVVLDIYSDDVALMVTKIREAGLGLAVRYTPNIFGIPFFKAFLTEASDHTPVSIATGSAAHPMKQIALVRSISEAAQSRLSHIHGGRDDIIRRTSYFEKAGRHAELQAIARLRNHAFENNDTINLSAIPDCECGTSIGSVLSFLLDALNRAGIQTAYRVPLTKGSDELQVIRVVVPGLESFQPTLKRVGPRLLRYVKEFC